MALTLGSNIASLSAQRQLVQTDQKLSQVFERLSSGQRINRASDDAAGLAIAESLKADTKIFAQGVRNLNDGISLLNIADSSIENLSGIVVRLQELAEQAANGVYGLEQRKALDAEAQALSDEYFRISKVAEFNGQSLFSGDNPIIALQAGVGENATIETSVGGAIGTGGLESGNTFATGNTVTAGMSLTDVNGDGELDLLTSGVLSGVGNVSVQLGTGSGSFGSSTTYIASDAAYSIQMGDVNGDGILDLLTAGNNGASLGTMSVLIGNASGGFGVANSYSMETLNSFQLAVGDVNGDGNVDVVTAGYTSGLSGSATIRLGDGTGGFGAATSFASESGGSWTVELADLNNDGNLDLVTGGIGAGGQVSVRLGDGVGSFGAVTSFQASTGNIAYDIKLEDLNGDGNIDLIASGGSTKVNISLGDGSGSFGTTTSYDTSLLFHLGGDVEVGDLNGDGIKDLVVTGYYGAGGGASVLLGVGDGSFDSATAYDTDPTASFAAKLGDVNGDGVLDLVTAGNSVDATVRLGEAVAGVAPLLEFSLETSIEARQALPVFQRKLEQLAEQRGEIGAYMARIDVASNVLGVASENFRAAESRIRDADIAAESSELTRLGILQQSAAAVLAQANQQPSLAIQLLGT